MAAWDKTGLPPLSLGFVLITALCLLMPASVVTAKAGSCLAHRLSKAHLERAFGVYLLAVSGRFFASALAN